MKNYETILPFSCRPLVFPREKTPNFPAKSPSLKRLENMNTTFSDKLLQGVQGQV